MAALPEDSVPVWQLITLAPVPRGLASSSCLYGHQHTCAPTCMNTHLYMNSPHILRIENTDRYKPRSLSSMKVYIDDH